MGNMFKKRGNLFNRNKKDEGVHREDPIAYDASSGKDNKANSKSMADNSKVKNTAAQKKTGNGATNDSGSKKVIWKRRDKKPWSQNKKIVLITCLIAIPLILIGGTVYAYSILSDPMSQFDTIAEQASALLVQTESTASATDGVSPTETIDPEQELLSEADLSMLENSINIMLIGVDHSEERDSDEWTGKTAFHADVMIVLNINTETGKVSMISLPRDTYAKIPGVDGIYKLNASIDCGGGWPTEAGFEKVCEAAEWMLGGNIPIDYYFAVDMNAVKGLVDAIGGVDYDVDISFYIQDRYYEKGEQHMDGQAVLDYLRVRKKNSGSTQGIVEGGHRRSCAR